MSHVPHRRTIALRLSACRAPVPPRTRNTRCARCRRRSVAPELVSVADETTLREMLRVAAGAQRQKVLLVVDGAGNVRGLVELARLQMLLLDELGWANAHDVMEPFASVEPGTPLTEVSERLGSCGLVQLPVVEQGSLVGLVGETELACAYARAIDHEDARVRPRGDV